MEELPESDCAESLPSCESPPEDDDSERCVESLPGDTESLPSDAESDIEIIMPLAPKLNSVRDRKEDLPDMCCVHNCIHCIETECATELKEWQTVKNRMSNDEANDFIYKLLLVMRGMGEVREGSLKQRIKFKLFGQYVCRTGFRESIGIGNSKLNRLLCWLKGGHMQPPRDLRHSGNGRKISTKNECDAALQWVYDILAESINSSDVRPADHDVDASAPELKAKPNDDESDPVFLAMPTIDGLCEWVHGPGASVTSTAAEAGEVKWLPPMALVDLFDLCKEHMLQGATMPSYSTFFRCYNETWQHCLRFRPKIMQSKCDDCERLKLLRKQATTPEKAEAVRAEHKEHIKSTFHDRAVDERIQKAAHDATTTAAGVPLARSILNMDMDAMEAMKFKCPRNVGGAKMMQALWRPQQHMVGSIVDGCTDHYWLVPPDVVKNANLAATLTADVLHQTAALLRQRGVPLPQTFRVHSDNAAGEVKNQTFMKFMAFLAHRHFNSTEMSQFRPGHSHGRIDQTFTVLGTALNKQNVLQTPDDFQRVMEATRGKSGSRPMRVVQVGAVYDWKEYFASLGIKSSSHTQTPAMNRENKEACHVFRFFRRDCMHNLPGGLGAAVMPHTVFEEPPAGDDVILVTKHLLSSQSFAQDPVVFCPGSRFRALSAGGPGVISGRVLFSDRQQTEFLKTADAIKQSPWNMARGHDWLTTMVAANRQKGFSPTWVPPVISWVVSGGQQHVVPAAPLPSVPRALPLAAPAPVRVADVKRRITRKRPASEVFISQRARNLARPNAANSVAGAPLQQVNENGAPGNVAAPRTRPAVPVVPVEMTTRMRNWCLKTVDEPSLGCPRCRYNQRKGCDLCRHKRDAWRFLHQDRA